MLLWIKSSLEIWYALEWILGRENSLLKCSLLNYSWSKFIYRILRIIYSHIACLPNENVNNHFTLFDVLIWMIYLLDIGKKIGSFQKHPQKIKHSVKCKNGNFIKNRIWQPSVCIFSIFGIYVKWGCKSPYPFPLYEAKLQGGSA